MKRLIIIISTFISLLVVKNLLWLFGVGSFYIILGEIFIVGLFILLAYKLFNVLKFINTDDLTGTYNRKYFFEELKKEIERTKRQDNYLSLCMFDLDDFKAINDGYGHFLGDIVLKEFSDIVLSNIREYDIFARLGGEEFALLIVDNNKDYAYKVCERIRKKVEEKKFDTNIQMTISIGIANWKDCDNMDTLYEKADNAMYESKNKGKNITTIWKNGIVKDGTSKTCEED